MKSLIDTRNDFKREINSLKRFSDRTNIIQKQENGKYKGVTTVPGNKYGVKITNWQKTEMNRRIGNINRKRKTRLEKMSDIEMTDRGKRLGYTKSDIGMGKLDEVALRPLKAFTPSMTTADVKKKFKAILRESGEAYWTQKEKMLMENVIKGLKANYSAIGFKDDIEEIVSAIENMDFNEFYKKFMGESGVMEIVSPPRGSSMMDVMEQNVSALKSIWTPKKKPKKKEEE